MPRVRRCCCCQNIYLPNPSLARLHETRFHRGAGLPNRVSREAQMFRAAGEGLRRIAVDYRNERVFFIVTIGGTPQSSKIMYRDRRLKEPDVTVITKGTPDPTITYVTVKPASGTVLYAAQAQVTPNANTIRRCALDGTGDVEILAGDVNVSLSGTQAEILSDLCYCRLNDRLYYAQFRPLSSDGGDIAATGTISWLRSCSLDGADVQTLDTLGPVPSVAGIHKFMHVHYASGKLYLGRRYGANTAELRWYISRCNLDGSAMEDVLNLGLGPRGFHQLAGLAVSNEEDRLVAYYLDRGTIIAGSDTAAWFDCTLDGTDRRALGDNRDFLTAFGHSTFAENPFGIEAACGYEKFGASTKA